MTLAFKVTGSHPKAEGFCEDGHCNWPSFYPSHLCTTELHIENAAAENVAGGEGNEIFQNSRGGGGGDTSNISILTFQKSGGGYKSSPSSPPPPHLNDRL